MAEITHKTSAIKPSHIIKCSRGS